MPIKKQFIIFYTIVRRELVRMARIASQMFLPPVITTALYFLIFGTLLGSRVGNIDHVNYGTFITPGLIMMAVITSAYANVSSSLFSIRFQRSIEEMLVSPIADIALLLGYVTGGILRGVLVACLVFMVSWALVPIHIAHVWLSLIIIILVATIFSLAGFINAILARNFDDIMIVPTFVLTPLSYLGGVFYTTTMLSPIWQNVSSLNPILYMVNALRYTMIDFQETSFLAAMFIMIGLFFILLMINLFFLRKGIGLRE